MPTTHLRCATRARAAELDPIGTAGYAETIVVIDHTHPWPPEPTSLPILAPLLEALRAAGAPWRLQLTIPHSSNAFEATLYRRPPGAFRAFTSERLSAHSPGDCVDACVASLTSTRTETRDAGPTGIDVLVCSHGSRDVCCGSDGTKLAARAQAMSNGTYRLRRTSHLGGHRFAPTALLLPEGSMWANLSPELLDAIVDRTLDPATAASMYRGCLGLPSPAVQAAERHALTVDGWSVLSASRSSYEHRLPNGDTIVDVDVATGAVTTRHRVVVSTIEQWGRPECGSPTTTTKTQAILSVAPAAEVDPLTQRRSEEGRP